MPARNAIKRVNDMVETGLRSIPVVLDREGRRELVGMVSRGDVIRGFRLALHDDK